MVILSLILMVVLSLILMVTVFAAPPKINVPPRFREVCTFEKGESVVLKIPFTGNPKPTVKWIRDGEELRGTRYHQEVTERHAILTIKVRTVVKVTALGRGWWLFFERYFYTVRVVVLIIMFRYKLLLSLIHISEPTRQS